MSDERRDGFGLPDHPPDAETAVVQYLNRSMHKLHVAEYHRREFERLEDQLKGEDFFDFEGEPFLPVQAHADGTLIQLSAAFDAFACAVAHRCGCLKDPERASFARDNERLAEAEPGNLGSVIREIGEDPAFKELQLYRNLAAHRGVIGERMRGAAFDEGVEVWLLLPDWLPPDFPDYPGASVRPVLERYSEWARPQLERLQKGARDWQLEDEPSGEFLGEDEPEKPAGDRSLGAEAPAEPVLPTPEERAPRFGEWRAWFSSGSHDFDASITIPPAWHLRHQHEPIHNLSAVELGIDELRTWIENLAGPEVAKAVLRDYRPRVVQTNLGRALFPERQA